MKIKKIVTFAYVFPSSSLRVFPKLSVLNEYHYHQKYDRIFYQTFLDYLCFYRDVPVAQNSGTLPSSKSDFSHIGQFAQANIGQGHINR